MRYVHLPALAKFRASYDVRSISMQQAGAVLSIVATLASPLATEVLAS